MQQGRPAHAPKAASPCTEGCNPIHQSLHPPAYQSLRACALQVRSSSLFEDAFLQPFAGIYRTVIMPFNPHPHHSTFTPTLTLTLPLTLTFHPHPHLSPLILTPLPTPILTLTLMPTLTPTLAPTLTLPLTTGTPNPTLTLPWP